MAEDDEARNERLTIDKPGAEESFEDVIEAVGIGRTQWVLLIICGLTFCSDAAEVTFLSFVLEVLKCKWGFNSAQESAIASAVFIGMIIGAPIWGFISDGVGRRPAFLLSSVVICVFGFSTALAWNFESLLCLRGIVGMGVAGLPIGFDILAEALPPAGRGAFLLYIEYFWTLGSIYVNLCAWLTLGPNGSWQLFTALAAVPTLVASISGFFLLPESPRWLADMNRGTEAVAIVNRWAVANKSEKRVVKLAVPPPEDTASILDICRRPKLRKTMGLMVIVWFAFGIAYYGIVMLLPRLFQERQHGKARRLEGDTCSVAFDFQDLAISSTAEVFGVIFALFMINDCGRTYTQGIFYALGAVAALLLGVGQNSHKTFLVIVASVGRLAEMAASCATWVHTPELFPTKVRSLAHTFLNLCSKVGATGAQYLISDMFSHLSRSLIMAAISLAAGIAAMFLTETAGTKLSEMSESEEEPDEDESDSEE